MITVNDIAKLVGGKVTGDGTIPVTGMSSPVSAKDGDITFVLNEEDFECAAKSKASSILTTIVTKDVPCTILQVDDIKLAVTILYNAMLEMKTPGKGSVHPAAVIAETVKIGTDVSIGPNVVIEDNSKIGSNTCIGANCFIGHDVSLGEGVTLRPNVTLNDNTVIGNNVTVHSGTVIGADGFGYIPKDDKIYKVPQLGNVIIEDDVEIGANVCIDRGTFSSTVIKKGAKIDNLVQIAHNVKIGKNVLCAAQTGIAGTSTVGDNTLLGGQVGIADHLNIGSNVKLGAKTGVYGSVKDDEIMFGYPARKAADARKLFALLSLLLKHERKFRAILRNASEGKKEISS